MSDLLETARQWWPLVLCTCGIVSTLAVVRAARMLEHIGADLEEIRTIAGKAERRYLREHDPRGDY